MKAEAEAKAAAEAEAARVKAEAETKAAAEAEASKVKAEAEAKAAAEAEASRVKAEAEAKAAAEAEASRVKAEAEAKAAAEVEAEAKAAAEAEAARLKAESETDAAEAEAEAKAKATAEPEADVTRVRAKQGEEEKDEQGKGQKAEAGAVVEAAESTDREEKVRAVVIEGEAKADTEDSRLEPRQTETTGLKKADAQLPAEQTPGSEVMNSDTTTHPPVPEFPHMAGYIRRPNKKGGDWVKRWVEVGVIAPGDPTPLADSMCCYKAKDKKKLLNSMKMYAASKIRLAEGQEEVDGKNEGVFIIEANNKEYHFMAESKESAQR